MIFRIVLFTIIYIIFLCIIHIVPSRFHSSLIGYVNYVGMCIIGFNSMKCTNKHVIEQLYQSDEPVIIVCNHISLLDGFILSSATSGMVSYMFDNKLVEKVPGFKYILERYMNALVKQPKDTTKQIKQHLLSRQKNDPILCLFADAMNPVPIDKNIAPFKTGAFVHKVKVLPIIIKYKNYKVDPTFRWFNNEHFFWGFSKILFDNNIDIVVNIMDPITPEENWSIDNYKDHVYELMNRKYELI